MLLMLEYHARMQKLQKMLAAIRHSNTKPKKLLLNTHPWRTPRWMSNLRLVDEFVTISSLRL